VRGSCLARRNSDQGSFTVTGTGGLPVTPYDDRIDSWYALPGGLTARGGNETSDRTRYLDATATSLTVPHSSPSTLHQGTTSFPKWQAGSPIVEAQGIVKTADGRILLASNSQRTTESAQSLICHPE